MSLWWTLLCCPCLLAIYTDDFVVQLAPGADPVKVGSELSMSHRESLGEGWHHYRHGKINRRSAAPMSGHLRGKLDNHRHVVKMEQQQARKRVKRDYFSALEPPADPLYPSMFYLDPAFPNRAPTDLDRDGRPQIRHMNITGAWEQGYSGAGVVVTILDDGIEYNHTDLSENYDELASFDINDNDADPMPSYNQHNRAINFASDKSYKVNSATKLTEQVIGYQKELNRHGTRCAGEVAATANNSVCVPGIAYRARVGGIRMLDGDVTDLVEAKSIGWRPDHVDIYSASWGPDDDGQTVDGPATLARAAFRRGAETGRNGLGSIFVWASGNGGKFSDNCNCDGYTNSIYTVSISSTSQNERIPWYSEACASTLASTYSSGDQQERQIVTTDLHNICTQSHTGTSASAPIAAAILALALEANPALGWRDMQHLLVRTSRKRLLHADDWRQNSLGRDYSHRYGYGLIDAGALVELAHGWRPVPPQRNRTVTLLDQKINAPLDLRAEFVNNEALFTIEVKRREKLKIDKLEHVVVVLSIAFAKRGELRLEVTSPHGTKSTILDKRPNDKSRKGFDHFEFLSVHFWDESPIGNWTLKIVNLGGSRQQEGSLKHFQLRLHGTGYDQYDVECPHAQVYDLVHFLCISNCSIGTYQKGPPPNSDSQTDQCARCPKNCVRCTGPRTHQCAEFAEPERKSRNREDDCQNGDSLNLLTTGFFSTPELSQRQLLVNFVLVAVGFGAILVFNKKRKKQTILYTPLPTIIDR